MPNQQNVNFTKACKRFDEAIRAIEKYQFKAEKEPNALLDPEMDSLNGIYYTNPCMHHKKGTHDITKGLRKFYKEKIGKDPTDASAVCTCIVTMPKDFMKAHYKVKGEDGKLLTMTDHQYTLLDKYFKEKENGSLSSLNAEELKEVKKLKESIVHPQWTEEELKKIHQFMMAATFIYCKMAGVKGPKITFEEDGKTIKSMAFEGSDVLWSISHLSESWPHLHLAYMPCAYMKDKTLLKKHEAGLEKRQAKVQEMVDSGVKRRDANKMVPKLDRPYALDGDLGREIDWNEKPVCSTVRRFRNGYLRGINKFLEKGLLEEFGIEAKIATGKGNKYNIQETKKDERFEGSTDEKLYEELVAEKERIAKELAEANAKNEQAQNELTVALAYKEQAEEELRAAQVETIAAKEEAVKAYDALAEMDAELAAKNDELLTVKARIRDYMFNFKNLVKQIFKDAITVFLPKLRKASFPEREGIFVDVEAYLSSKVEESVESITGVSEVVSTPAPEVDMGTFDKTPQRFKYAVNKIKKASEGTPLEDVLADANWENCETHPAMKYCIEDWFNREKYQAEYIGKDEEERKLFRSDRLGERAQRALSYLDFCIENGVADITLSESDIELE